MPVLTDDFTYVLTSTGVVLNPTALTSPFVDITKVKGLDSADLRTTERDHEGVDGGFIDAYYEKMRVIVLEGQLYCNDYLLVESYLDSLKSNWGPVRLPIPFYFKKPGVSERLILVKPLGVKYDVDELRRLGCCAVQFMAQAEDPRVYTSDGIVEAAIPQGAASVTGFGFPLGFPFGFGAPVTPATFNAANLGNRSTPAVIKIPGPVTNPRIYNDTVSKGLEFTIDLASGEFLEIDLYYKTVKLNGTVSRRSALINPTWFLLEPGDNFLRYQADTTGNPSALITYRHAWR